MKLSCARCRALLLSLCLSALVTAAAAAPPPRVVVSIAPLHSLAAGVMAGVAEPELLLSAASSPHVSALRPSQRRSLHRAELVFWVGPELEPFLIKPLQAGTARSEALLRGAPTRLPLRRGGVWGDHVLSHDRHFDERHDDRHHDEQADDPATATLDPHFWLDPVNARASVGRMAAALAELDPGRAEVYRGNAARLSTELEHLEQRLRERLRAVRADYLVFHDAYQYFEHRFGLRPLGAVALEPSLLPGAGRLRALREALHARRARCVFSEPQFPPRLLAALVEGSQIETAELDPLGASLEPGPGLYFELLEKLGDGLVRCLAD